MLCPKCNRPLKYAHDSSNGNEILVCSGDPAHFYPRDTKLFDILNSGISLEKKEAMEEQRLQEDYYFQVEKLRTGFEFEKKCIWNALIYELNSVSNGEDLKLNETPSQADHR